MRLAAFRVLDEAGPGDWRALLLACCIGLAIPCAGLADGVSLNVPPRVEPGHPFEVDWHGPNASGDFIAIAQPGEAPAKFLAYARTSRGNPTYLSAPEPGEFKVRYISAADLRVLGTAILHVAPATIGNLSAPSEAELGTPLAITVAEPGNPANYVTIVEAEAPNDALGPYARLQGETEQVSLVAPETPGDYEIRYVDATSLSVLARAPLVVRRPTEQTTAGAAGTAQTVRRKSTLAPTVDAEVGLMALLAVDRARTFHVAWTGPGAKGDWIAILPVGSSPDEALSSQPVAAGSPLGLVAPEETGNYQIVYIAGHSGAVLARRTLEVR